MNNSARLSAVRILMRLFDGNLSDVERVISDCLEDKRESDLCRKIVLGVVEKNEELIYRIDSVSKIKTKKMNPLVAADIKAAVYQAVYLDRVPDFAAVNEAVEIVKKNLSPNLGGFVNAVVRACIRNKESVDFSSSREAKYCLPEWIINSFYNDYGKDAEKIFDGYRYPTNDYIRINSLKSDYNKLREFYGNRLIYENEFTAQLVSDGDITDDLPFSEGQFHFQNLSSQLAVSVLSPKEGETVLDCCASPGGKSFTASEIMNNRGHIDAVDINGKKVSKINDGAKRLGITIIETHIGDSSEYKTEKLYDRVICDAPCSGLGLLRNKPYIKLKKEEDIADLPSVQYAILSNCSKFVKHGGVLVYSTCSLRKCENEDVVLKLLHGGDFEIVPVNPGIENCLISNGMVTVIPNEKYEGFFIAKLLRR